jgi:hypothetical protein
VSADFKLSGYRVHAEARDRYVATENSTHPPLIEVIPTLESQVKMKSTTEKNAEYRLEGYVVQNTAFNFTLFTEKFAADSTGKQY